MRKTILLTLLLCSVSALSAQFIYFVSAEQYQTISGWRLHVVLDMGPMPWPPSNYDRTELLLSTMPMGVHEPYNPIATLERKIAERDPEFLLLGEMMTDVTWYGRIMVYANGSLTAYTDEFTFVLPGDAVDKFHTGSIPWVSVDDAWQTSVAIHNPSENHITVTYMTWTGPQQNPILLENTVDIWPRQTHSFYVFPEARVHAAMDIIATGPFSWMSLLNLRDSDIWIGFNGESQ